MPSTSTFNLNSTSQSPNNDVLVRVQGVSKKFCRSLKKSLWYGVQDIAYELNPFGGGEKLETRNLKPEELEDPSAPQVSSFSFQPPPKAL